MSNKFKNALINSAKPFYNNLPVLIGIILLVSLINVLVPKSAYTIIFSKNIFLDSIIGSGLGSILTGNPITSYILGGELIKQGVSLAAVTSFLVAWVTVGLVQLPAEAILLGKKFAVLRNIISFAFAVIVALITVSILYAWK